jgi:hypothetical protein
MKSLAQRVPDHPPGSSQLSRQDVANQVQQAKTSAQNLYSGA